MPEALLAIPVALEAIGAAASGVAGAAGVFGLGGLGWQLGGVALSVGLSYVASLIQTKQPSQPQQAQQVTVTDSTAARVRGYGRCFVGGARMAWENVTVASGAAATGRVALIAHCQGPVDAIEEYHFSDDLGAFVLGVPAWGANGTVSYPFQNLAVLQSNQGNGSQAVSAWVQSILPNWTANDRARGICYTAAIYTSVQQKDFLTYYKSGEPTVRVVMRMAKVYDPRTGQSPNDAWDQPAKWTWSDNPALCILDYLRHPDGRNKPLSRIDLQTFIDFANLCDQAVTLKHGGTEKRYRLSGTYSLTDEPSAVMKRLLATCDGEIYRTAAGLIGIRGGQWVDPTLTFQGDSILAFSLSQGVGKLAAFNRTTITYTSPLHDYQAVEADPWVDTVSEALIGSLPTSLDLDMVPSNGQARRLAKINAFKGNPDWRGQITLDISGLNAIAERVIRVTLPTDDLGIDDVFMVTKAAIAPDFTSVTLEVISLDPAAYAWDAASEEGEAPPLVTTVAAGAVPTPSGFTATATTGTAAGGVVSSINVSVTPPADTSLRLVVQWALAGSGNWTQATATPGNWTLNTGVLADGVSYDVEAQFVATTTIQGAWTAPITVAIAASLSVPGTPSALSGSNSGGTVTLGATAPNASSVSRIVFWRSSGTSFAGATRGASIFCSANQPVVAYDTPGSGTWHYWATAENVAYQDSSPVGYVTVIV